MRSSVLWGQQGNRIVLYKGVQVFVLTVRAHNDSIVHKASVVAKESHNKHVSDTTIGKGIHKNKDEC